MAIHDWTQVDAGIFHDFHQSWTVELCHVLNDGLLFDDYFSVAGRYAIEYLPELVPQSLPEFPARSASIRGGVAVLDAPPQASHITSVELDAYAERANRIVVKHRLGDVVAVVEVVSPGNKSGRHRFSSFIDKATELIRRGIHLMVVDLFPPSPRDPSGIHKAIWDEFQEEPFESPANKPLTVASYMASEKKTAYVEPVAVGDELPSLPIFLSPDIYVPAPLENTYQTTWSKCPAALREYVDDPNDQHPC